MATSHKIFQKKNKPENNKIDGKTTENAEIYAKDSKASKSSERLQKGSFILQNIINCQIQNCKVVDAGQGHQNNQETTQNK